MKENDSSDENVFYCKRCLSLAIIADDDDDVDYCNECGNTDIGEVSIE